MGTGQASGGLDDPENNAIIPRSIQMIFEHLNGRSGFELYASFLEIYNEEVHDLLSPHALKTASKPFLTIREGNDGNIYVAGITEERVNDYDQLLRYLSSKC